MNHQPRHRPHAQPRKGALHQLGVIAASVPLLLLLLVLGFWLQAFPRCRKLMEKALSIGFVMNYSQSPCPVPQLLEENMQRIAQNLPSLGFPRFCLMYFALQEVDWKVLGLLKTFRGNNKPQHQDQKDQDSDNNSESPPPVHLFDSSLSFTCTCNDNFFIHN
eukprot:m.107879 g.107879  ORF g.107879 m.107879 type:complete len:162 (-) comp22604_c0_seq1:89-574(-)